MHILVTNDFPPKVGGIQSYLFELWRRLDPASYAVLTASPGADCAAFDDEQRASGMRIHRLRSRVLAPTPHLIRAVHALVDRYGASLVVIDPIFPLGVIGRQVERHSGAGYALIAHGAEVTIPAALPGSAAAMRLTVRGARGVVCAGEYPAAQITALSAGAPIYRVPPGVNCETFRPLDPAAVTGVRKRWGLQPDGLLVLSLSRLVARKGMDVLIEASSQLLRSFPDLEVAIAGKGRDEGRLRRLAQRHGAPVSFLGEVEGGELPGLYGMADLFVMACRDRWAGLESEGFGIVFLEAAACGVAQVAGRSGGSHEAVADGVTGLVVDDPRDAGKVAQAMRQLLSSRAQRTEMGEASRARAVGLFDYGTLVPVLEKALQDMESARR